MKKKITIQNFRNSRHVALLVLVFFIAFGIAVFPASWQDHIYRSSISLLFFASIIAIEKNIRSFLVPVIMAILIQWFAAFFDLYSLEMISKLINFIFFLYITVYFVSEIVKAKEVTSKVILEAIIGYLLMGIIFAILITTLVQIDPGTFSFSKLPEEPATSHFSEYLYFSYVTLSTVGYGDFVPLQPVSRSLSILISVSGQMYLAIIIAMLVGKYAGKRNSSQ